MFGKLKLMRKDNVYIMNLTYKWIIDELSKDGCGSKQVVKAALENATVEDLQHLKRSINEEIR